MQIWEERGSEQSWQPAKTISKSEGKGVGYLNYSFWIFRISRLFFLDILNISITHFTYFEYISITHFEYFE